MKTILIIITLLFSAQAQAEVRKLSLELKRMPFNRDYFFPGMTEWDYETSVLWDVSLGRWFMESDITGRTAGSRYRYVNWTFTTGLSLTPWLDVIWDHESEHALDYEREQYPVRDGYGIRINFVEKK